MLSQMDKLSGEKKDILIMGCFSIKLLNDSNDKDTTTFLDTMFSNSFSTFVTAPTRVGKTSEILIGNMFYNKPSNNDMIAGNLCSVISKPCSSKPWITTGTAKSIKLKKKLFFT